MKSPVAGLTTAFLTLALTSAALHAEVKVLRVDPQQTDPGIAEVHGPHIALYDAQVPSVHKLFVFLSGTRGKAENSLTLDTALYQVGLPLHQSGLRG